MKKKVVLRPRKKELTRGHLVRIARKILLALNARNSEVEIALLSRASLATLASRFLKKREYSPGVLAFSESRHFPHPESKKKVLGEVYLDQQILKHDPKRALVLLAHGILHLLGYRHQGKGDTISMERMEKKLWDRVLSSV